MICGDCLYYIDGVCTIYNANVKKNNDSKACLRYIDKTILNAKAIVYDNNVLKKVRTNNDDCSDCYFFNISKFCKAPIGFPCCYENKKWKYVLEKEDKEDESLYLQNTL